MSMLQPSALPAIEPTSPSSSPPFTRKAAILGVMAALFLAVGVVAGLQLVDKDSPLATKIGTGSSETTAPTNGFYGLDLGDGLIQFIEIRDADTLTFDFGKDDGDQIASYAFRQLLEQLGFNATATVARLGTTRALDGTQSAEGSRANAYWTYHPDNGLNIIFERK